ncbi:MAG: hypothetical protein QOK38_1742 [Acidobacteriaceae bacterium]|jgi:hypothetical protein|nr:hypothetical protein [Acidobacteriaceae bacterium]
MTRDIRTLSILCVVWTLLALGCTSTRTTPLCDGFKSSETVKEVRNRLNQDGTNGPWRQESKSLGPPDRRPPYQFIVLSGPFRLSNISGSLKLTFYNDRLMSTEFSTVKGGEYLAALRQHGKVPSAVGVVIVPSGRTRLRYYVDPGGSFRFLWSDWKLEDEWSQWISDHA